MILNADRANIIAALPAVPEIDNQLPPNELVGENDENELITHIRLVSPYNKKLLCFPLTEDNKDIAANLMRCALEEVKIEAVANFDLKGLGDDLVLEKVKNFNNISEKIFLKKERMMSPRKATPEMAHIISKMCYKSVVTNFTLLHQTGSFTPSTYGEIKIEQLEKFFDAVEIKKGETFVDLGSGVGQVVLYIAARTEVKLAFGIEKEEAPHNYAQALGKQFKKIMHWFSCLYAPFELLHGNFLDAKFREKILQSSMVFTNNFIFGVGLNQKIGTELLQNLGRNARIISSSAFKPEADKRDYVTSRELNSISSILDVKQLETTESNTNWTNNRVFFFLHWFNYERVDRYYKALQKKESNGRKTQRVVASNNNRVVKRKAAKPTASVLHPSPPRNTRNPKASSERVSKARRQPPTARQVNRVRQPQKSERSTRTMENPIQVQQPQVQGVYLQPISSTRVIRLTAPPPAPMPVQNVRRRAPRRNQEDDGPRAARGNVAKRKKLNSPPTRSKRQKPQSNRKK